MIKTLCIIGTRPEAIKFAPIISSLKQFPNTFEVIVCATAQHREMLDQVLDFFDIVPDVDLNVMRQQQKLSELTSILLKGISKVIEDCQPSLILVQGDTTTAMTGALAGFYKEIPVAHIEAGLRSGDTSSPFPEEAHRKIITDLASIHFPPTSCAEQNLLNDGIKENIFVVGNTVIDALMMGINIIEDKKNDILSSFSGIDFDKKIVLVTGHRRENFGKALDQVLEALLQIADGNPDVEIVFPVHLNPKVSQPVSAKLSGRNRIHLIPPLEYPRFIWLMKQAYLIITDSGGIQEEAPSLGTPVIVTRDTTERVEGIEAGVAFLTGPCTQPVVEMSTRLLTDSKFYTRVSRIENPYGDGRAAEKITRALSAYFGELLP